MSITGSFTTSEKRFENVAIPSHKFGFVNKMAVFGRDDIGVNTSGNAHPREDGAGHATKEQDGDENDSKGGGEEDVSVEMEGVDGVECESKSDSTTETTEPHDKLMVERNGVFGRAGKIDDSSEREYVGSSSNQASENGNKDEKAVPAVRESKDGQTEEGEDGSFGQESNNVEKVVHGMVRRFRQVVLGIVSHCDTAEKNADDAREMETFGDDIRQVRI